MNQGKWKEKHTYRGYSNSVGRYLLSMSWNLELERYKIEVCGFFLWQWESTLVFIFEKSHWMPEEEETTLSEWPDFDGSAVLLLWFPSPGYSWQRRSPCTQVCPSKDLQIICKAKHSSDCCHVQKSGSRLWKEISVVSLILQRLSLAHTSCKRFELGSTEVNS